MTAPPIIVVVPTLNSLPWMPTLVRSLQSQTWRHWRVLIVDGGSGPEMIHYLNDLCVADPRFSWRGQSPEHVGIFGAMNQGMRIIAETPSWRQAWLLFWGSDDWAATPDALQRIVDHLQILETANREPDLLICRARYAQKGDGGQWQLLRRSSFTRLLSYPWALRLGFTPPHQGTLFAPKVRERQPAYREAFRLSADLDYFLRLSRFDDLEVDLLAVDLVVMATGGVSGTGHNRRFQEVRWAYQRRYGGLWWLSFGLRYLKRGLEASLARL